MYRTKLEGEEEIEFILYGARERYFGTFLFTIGQNPEGDEGDKAYILKHVDNDNVFTWLPIGKGPKPKRQTRDCSNCGEQFESLYRMKFEDGKEIRLCHDCHVGV